MRTFVSMLVVVVVSFACHAGEIQWERVKLDGAFRSEGVAVADLNHDGKNDVVAGDVWYEAPNWKMHAFRNVGQFVAGKGYSNSFCNYTYDINRDGWADIVVVGFPGAPFHWYQNPQNKPGNWKEHVIWRSICNESPDFADITGDGVPEFVFGSQPEKQMGFVSVPSGKSVFQQWNFQPISKAGDPNKNGTFKYYHGLGYGDLNKDGRTDVLIMHGWWEAPAEKVSGPWQFHPYKLSKDTKSKLLKGADIHVYDLDLDGDNDLVTSCAHSFGVWWFENVGGNSKPEFKYHLIDESYSQTHAMEFVDINGDGTKDIVTGKRYFAHNGRDPGGNDPIVMYWYEIQRKKGSPPRFIPHEIKAGRGTGVGTQFQATDINGDGRIDIVLSNKAGVNILLQKPKS